MDSLIDTIPLLNVHMFLHVTFYVILLNAWAHLFVRFPDRIGAPWKYESDRFQWYIYAAFKLFKVLYILPVAQKWRLKSTLHPQKCTEKESGLQSWFHATAVVLSCFAYPADIFIHQSSCKLISPVPNNGGLFLRTMTRCTPYISLRMFKCDVMLPLLSRTTKNVWPCLRSVI